MTRQWRDLRSASQGSSDKEASVNPAAASGELAPWVATAERLPCDEGDQVDVLFGSPHWATAIVGMFTHLGGQGEWSDYDQQNDKYLSWESETPMFWMLKPKLPDAAASQSNVETPVKHEEAPGT